jgi:redoxin
VLLFVRRDCPIANRYAPEIRRLEQRFAREGVAFWLVYPDRDEPADAIRRHLRDFDLTARALRDPGHVLVRKAKARISPEAAVFVPAPGGARLVYHGRIDDRYVELGRMRKEATIHDLEEVLEAVVAGRPAPRESAPAVGCFLADVE